MTPVSSLVDARAEAERVVKDSKASLAVTNEESVLAMNVSLIEVEDLFNFIVRKRPDTALD
jgi:hypothetical protein